MTRSIPWGSFKDKQLYYTFNLNSVSDTTIEDTTELIFLKELFNLLKII